MLRAKTPSLSSILSPDKFRRFAASAASQAQAVFACDRSSAIERLIPVPMPRRVFWATDAALGARIDEPLNADHSSPNALFRSFFIHFRLRRGAKGSGLPYNRGQKGSAP
jgi:hypothetical protein